MVSVFSDKTFSRLLDVLCCTLWCMNIFCVIADDNTWTSIPIVRPNDCKYDWRTLNTTVALFDHHVICVSPTQNNIIYKKLQPLGKIVKLLRTMSNIFNKLLVRPFRKNQIEQQILLGVQRTVYPWCNLSSVKQYFIVNGPISYWKQMWCKMFM